MKNVLIIEDERTFANIVGELIQAEGFGCTVAYSASEAEAQFEKLGREIHVVILDLMMARTGSFASKRQNTTETGDEIYEAIRSKTPDLPVIIMTAKTKDNLMKRYYTDKRTHVFLKPVNPGMITQLISLLKEYDK